jgi:hypothetical protein
MEYNIKMNLKEISICSRLDSSGSGYGSVVGSYEHGNELSDSKKAGNFSTS